MTERILKMPRLGETMDEGRIVGWLIRPGDAFKRGDPIIEIETDKTVAEFPALGDGRLGEILVAIGDMVAVGDPLARIDIGEGPDWTAEDGEESAPAPVGNLVETDLVMPRLGETMEEGRIVKWLKVSGDEFVRGEAIIEIETDKTVAEFPALTDGRLVAILRHEDEMVTVGEPIARIAAPADIVETAAPQVAPAAAEPATMAKPAPRFAPRPDGRVRATPLARRLACRHGLDIASIAGSGRRGRVEKADVLTAVGGGAAPDGVTFAALKRGRMAYLDAGSGAPILLLHGFSGDRTTWASVAAGLKRAGRRVIAPDLPGHSLTEIAANDPRDLGADLPALLDALGVARVDVVGHSLGAFAALTLATAAPARVASLSLIAPAGLGSEIDDRFVHGMAKAGSPGEVAHLLRRLSVNGAELSEAALAALAADLARGRLVALSAAVAGPSGQRIDSLAAIEKLSAATPIRVLFGLEDRIIPWRQVLSLPPRVAIHVLARSGHMPQWDQPRDVVDILLS